MGKLLTLGLCLTVLACQAGHAFSSFDAEGGSVHGAILREALRGTVSNTNIEFMIAACNSQDLPDSDWLKESRRHFDDGNFAGALAYIDREKRRALNYAGDADTDPDNRARCLRHFALVLHTVQDFYSRSNYVELLLEDPRNQVNPYNVALVDWVKVPEGYIGSRSGSCLQSGMRSGATIANNVSYAELNKDNVDSPEGKRLAGGVAYFKVARDLALRETVRQWNLFEALIRSRYLRRSEAIIAALKAASPGGVAESD